MELTQEQLKKLESDAALLFTLTELAAVLGVGTYDLARAIKEPDSKVAQAYLRGRLQTMRSIRQELIDNATDGAPNAQQAVLELADRQEKSIKHI